MRIPFALLLVLAGLLAPVPPAAAQHAATLPPLDEAYGDLDRLAASGLVPRGLTGLAPYSRGRVAWIVGAARAALAAGSDPDPVARRDLERILDRLDARFGGAELDGPSAQIELEAGGGESPGLAYPDNGLGGLDAVLNPLWSGRGGRAYPDRSGLAAAARLDVPLSPTLSLSGAYRASSGSYAGELPGRSGGVVEALNARFVLGRVAFQAGRDAVWTDGEGTSLLLGGNGPPLDMIRIATDRPLLLHVLGDLDFSLIAADVASDDRDPDARIFGALFAAQPTPSLNIGLTVLDKQGTAVQDDEGTGEKMFSDKLGSVSVRYRGERLVVLAEGALTYADRRYPRFSLLSSAGYRVGVSAPRLGVTGRHALAVEASTLGPRLYRHGHVRSGLAVDGLLLGSGLGPDAQGATVHYGYDAPSRGWRFEGTVSLERRGGDVMRRSATDRDALRVVRSVPDDRRLRWEGVWVLDAAGGSAGVAVTAGVERAWNSGHVEGARAWNRMALVRLWWGF